MFTVDPTTLDFGTLTPGQTVDRTVAFDGVPPDVSGGAQIPLNLGSTTINIAVTATADNPEPSAGEIIHDPVLIQQGITVEVVQISASGMTVRASRAA